MYIYKSKYFAKKAAIIIMLILIVVACNKNDEQPIKEDTTVNEKTAVNGQRSEDVITEDKTIAEANEDGGEDTEKETDAATKENKESNADATANDNKGADTDAATNKDKETETDAVAKENKEANTDAATSENKETDAAINSYKDKVSKLRDSIGEVCSPMGDLDTSNLDDSIATIKKVIKDVAPLYEELGDLTAPERYKEQQIKLKNGSKETLELLNISSAVLELQKNKNKSEETDKKLSELQAKMMSMQIRVKEMNEALDVITKK